jgi:adenylosuccinate synthase
MDQKNLALIVGGYLGDEGKGKATQLFLEKYNKGENVLCLRSSGGTNTGATVYDESGTTRLSIHMLPAGAFKSGCDSYIGNAVYVNPTILIDELKQRQALNLSNPGRVFLSAYASVVTPDHLRWDAEKEKKQMLGSTKNGVSICAREKYQYSGVKVIDFVNGTKYTRLPAIIIRQHEIDTLIEQFRIMQKEYGVEIVEPFEFFEEVSKTHNMVLEGTQGVGLDVNHGFQYPFVSSGSFSTFGLLDGVGYALAPTDVCMVLKAYGSYFGPLREAGDFEDDDFRQFAGEFGTTTKRPRNLSWLDMRQVQRVASLVRPTSIMLNCLDLLDYFPEHGKPWSVIIDDENRIEFEDKPIVDGKLTSAGALFVETIEEYTNAPVTFLGVGPKHSDVIER